MNSHFLQDRIEFFQLQSLGGVLSVFGRDVSRRTWHTRSFVLCALHDYLYSISFLSHLRIDYRVVTELFDHNHPGILRFFQNCGNTVLIDSFQCLGRHFQGDPCVFFGYVESLLVKIWVKSTLSLIVCMGHVVTYARSFSGDVTNFCHDILSSNECVPVMSLQISQLFMN